MPDPEPYICLTCGVQHAASESPPERCLICNDERQYVGWGGQRWTTLVDMKAAGHANRFQAVEGEPGLTSIDTRPRFAIGQRALLVQTAGGNFLWDCISYIDDETLQRIHDIGGLHGLSVSHPHFYGAMIEWSHAFVRAPVFLPLADKEWLARPDRSVQWYEGTQEVLPGLTLVQCGGHFDGSAVLHWAEGGGGRGALLTGDTISVVADRRWVTFMRSYPNYIPLPESAVRGILQAVRPYPFERVYGGWWQNDVMEDGMGVVERSAERYITWTQSRSQESADAPKQQA
jgi:glyoxylase-like metal-dependent hydrolase (beta-lactamase superfamily II)